MSAYPRTVLTDTSVVWDGETAFVRRGSVVDIPPGSALETAYGGPSNLSAVIPASQRGDEADLGEQGKSN